MRTQKEIEDRLNALILAQEETAMENDDKARISAGIRTLQWTLGRECTIATETMNNEDGEGMAEFMADIQRDEEAE